MRPLLLVVASDHPTFSEASPLAEEATDRRTLVCLQNTGRRSVRTVAFPAVPSRALWVRPSRRLRSSDPHGCDFGCEDERVDLIDEVAGDRSERDERTGAGIGPTATSVGAWEISLSSALTMPSGTSRRQVSAAPISDVTPQSVEDCLPSALVMGVRTP